MSVVAIRLHSTCCKLALFFFIGSWCDHLHMGAVHWEIILFAKEIHNSLEKFAVYVQFAVNIQSIVYYL